MSRAPEAQLLSRLLAAGLAAKALAAEASGRVACHPAREMHAAAPKDLPGRSSWTTAC